MVILFYFFVFLLKGLLVTHVSFAGENYALLIGIGDYSLTPGFPDLEGAQNDIDIMENTLKSKRFGFDRIAILLNEQATHSRVEAAFRELCATIKKKPATAVYVYFSGHGSQTLDLNGDEPQIKDLQGNALPSYDQTWVTYGARLKKDTVPIDGFKEIDRYDILDDEIAQWLTELSRYSEQVVFVSDSCHSGSVSRKGVTAGIRRGPIDSREHILGRKPYTRLDTNNVICIGASRDDQVAKEYTPSGLDKKFGVFTWHWAKAIITSRPEDTWSHVFNRVSRIVFQETPNRQMPQISGAVSMNVFGPDFQAPAKTVTVYQISQRKGENQVFIDAGVLSGVSEGSVYVPEKQWGKPDASEIIVIRTTPTYSIGVAHGPVHVYEQLIEKSHHHDYSPIRLFIDVEYDRDRKEYYNDFRNMISEMAPYSIASDVEESDLIAYLFRPEGKAKTKAPPESRADAEPEVWILDHDGFLYHDGLKHACNTEGLALLRQNLLKLSRVKEFIALKSDQNTCPLQISITPMTPMENGAACYPCIPNDWPTPRCPAQSYKPQKPLTPREFVEKTWEPCTMVYFNAKNTTPFPYYFYVIYIGSQGDITPVFPSLADSAHVAEVPPRSQSLRGKAFIRLDTQTLDYYKIIVSKKAINHHLLFQKGFETSTRGKNKPSSLNPLEQIIWDMTRGSRSPARYEPGSWYVETLALDMRKDFR